MGKSRCAPSLHGTRVLGSASMRVRVAIAVASVFACVAAAPAMAAQPYPLNFKTFDLSGGTKSGLAYSNGALTLANKGLGSFDYADPFSAVTVLGQQVDGSGTYASGTW